jgi:hypothetical protein
LKSFAQTKPASLTAFRLPQKVLEAVDLACGQSDLTRSQIFRRSIVEYLKAQNIEILAEPEEQKLAWSTSPYKRNGG